MRITVVCPLPTLAGVSKMNETRIDDKPDDTAGWTVDNDSPDGRDEAVDRVKRSLDGLRGAGYDELGMAPKRIS